MPGAGDQQDMLIGIALIALAISVAVGLAFIYLRRNRGSEPNEEPLGEPGSVQQPVSIDQDPVLSALARRVDEIVARRLGGALEVLMDSDNRLRSDLTELRGRVELLAEGLRQGSKEIGAVEALLQDIVNILNISISESKSVSEKIQKHYGDIPKPVAQQAVHRLGQPR